MTSAGIRRFYGAAAVLAAIAGFLLVPLAAETDRFFSWTIEPPITAAFLGASYWAALVLLAWAARQRDWALARTAMPPVATIAALLLLTTLIHVDRFDLDSVFGWFWLVVYVCVTPALVWLVREQVRSAPAVPRGLDRPPPALTLALAAQGLALLGMGAALLVAPLDAAEIWPWQLSELTARAIGSFLIGFGVAAAFALWEGDMRRLRGVAAAWAALGVLQLAVSALRWDELTGSDAETVIYVAFWLLSVLVGGLGLALGRRSSSASASPGSR